MAYINRIIGNDEKLVGVARLHWIYIVTGLVWFIVLAYLGATSENLIMTMIMMFDRAVVSMNAPYITSVFSYVTPALMSFASYVNYIQAGMGAIILISAIIKVLVTEIGLTTRRVIHKKGWLAVNIKQIDLEEIRGENVDYGGFGRFFGYGRIKLDCRFIGDVKLPSIAHPENFMKALHKYRAVTQDAVSVMVGKGNATPVEFVSQRSDIPQEPTMVRVNRDEVLTVVSGPPDLPDMPQIPAQPQPEVQPNPQPQQQPEQEPPPQPEIQPSQEPQKPEVQPEPQANKQHDAELVAQVLEQVVPKIVQEMVKEGIVISNQSQQISAPAETAVQTQEHSLQETKKRRA